MFAPLSSVCLKAVTFNFFSLFWDGNNDPLHLKNCCAAQNGEPFFATRLVNFSLTAAGPLDFNVLKKG